MSPFTLQCRHPSIPNSRILIEPTMKEVERREWNRTLNQHLKQFVRMAHWPRAEQRLTTRCSFMDVHDYADTQGTVMSAKARRPVYCSDDDWAGRFISARPSSAIYEEQTLAVTPCCAHKVRQESASTFASAFRGLIESAAVYAHSSNWHSAEARPGITQERGVGGFRAWTWLPLSHRSYFAGSPSDSRVARTIHQEF